MSDTPRRLRASDFDPEVLHVFDQYVHGDIDRREFLTRVGRLALGTMTATAVLGALSPRFAEAQQVGPGDERIDARYVEYDSPRGYGRGRGYLVRPAKVGRKAATIAPRNGSRMISVKVIRRSIACSGRFFATRTRGKLAAHGWLRTTGREPAHERHATAAASG